MGGRDRQRYTSDFEEEYDGGSVQGRGQGRNYSEYDHKRESGMKTEIPEFKGGMQADEFLDWVANVEEIFDFKEVPEHRRVKLVATRLRVELWHGGSKPSLHVNEWGSQELNLGRR